MTKAKNTRKLILILFVALIISLALVFITDMIDHQQYVHMTPREILDYTIRKECRKGSTNGVKEEICTLKADGFPVLLYIDKSDLIEVALFDKDFNKDSLESCTGLDLVDLKSKNIGKSASWFDDDNGNRIVWGLYGSTQIKVNGKPATTKKIAFVVGQKRYTEYFWFVVLKGTPKYSIKAFT